MSRSAQWAWGGAAVAAYAAIQAHDLANAWAHAPFERGAWLILLTWLAPVAAARWRRLEVTPAWFWIGLAVALAGAASDRNVLKHAGLALALAGFLPWRRATAAGLAPWLAAAVAWMPAAGWLLKDPGPGPALALRLVAAAAASGLAWKYLR